MRVVVSGGGTGGHIYPALSLIKEIQKQQPESKILYIGTEKGLENDLVQREGIPFKTIHITGFRRKISLENVKTVVRFIKGVKQAKKMMKLFKPDVVIGTGGYVCGPVVYAAAKMRIPTVVHEQNSVPGLTNKFLSKYVQKVAICFEEASSFFPTEKVVFTGNPRASEVKEINAQAGKSSLGLQENKKTVLIVGGSRGAKPINDAFLSIVGEVGGKDYQVVYVTGNVHYDAVMEKVKEQGNPDNVIIKPFLHNMPDVLGAVDLIVARAGATTLAEVTAIGLPSILIPSPYVTNNHQERNARALSSKGAAILRLEKDMDGSQLLEDINKVFTEDGKWEMMKKEALQLGVPSAATNVYQLLKDISR
ncbi:undecaprenyldiphospho-muramoylpentapeptide beta-N-acetylglucosaminyltransferase [Bacillus solitudinis]|uniref:undecaprenyldiphospho-muramoylpentapeptide beta-N-acetylglucosaminyltransferase n=1 Tax=Bacillus solitudinis TaxID=2014074 RepID=UPI000C238D5E|nr:undecaprenyldiphospho-muramoylpentapeptide beta-N-acetylglucosaminyltransferase [Bacillus solitudinis]